ncbi:MAG: hypothetical protein HDQ87_10470 [Clostridia bacterium]|nr:hypothetical protein [Clostridia bacterium]
MTITDMQPARRSSRRVNVFLDEEFGFACYMDIASQFGLRKGAELDEADVAAVREADEQIAAREYALSLAARGPRSEKQFREKLRARGYGQAAQDAALDVLRTYGYLDDEAYARQYCAELEQKYGRWAMRRKLSERGIAPEIIDRVVAEADTDGALTRQLEKLVSRPRYEDPRREWDRIVRSLVAKGFDYMEVKEALTKRLRECGQDE